MTARTLALIAIALAGCYGSDVRFGVAQPLDGGTDAASRYGKHGSGRTSIDADAPTVVSASLGFNLTPQVMKIDNSEMAGLSSIVPSFSTDVPDDDHDCETLLEQLSSRMQLVEESGAGRLAEGVAGGVGTVGTAGAIYAAYRLLKMLQNKGDGNA